jgi:hypothetical protein
VADAVEKAAEKEETLKDRLEDIVDRAIERATALDEEVPESVNPKLYDYKDIEAIQKKWESKPLGQRDFRGPYVTRIPFAKSFPYSALIFGPDFTETASPYASFGEAYRRGQKLRQEAEQRIQNPGAPRHNPESDYLPPVIHVWRGWTHADGNFWRFTIETVYKAKSGRYGGGSYDHVFDKQFKTAKEAKEFALSVIGKPDYDAPRWKEAKVKIHQTYWSPAGYEQDPPREEAEVGASGNPSSDADEWPWAYQYIDAEKTEDEARQVLEWQKTQDGFIGGRVYYREDDRLWYSQAIAQDEGAGEDLPDGVRRVKMPPSMWSKLEDATGEKLTKDRGIALARRGETR